MTRKLALGTSLAFAVACGSGPGADDGPHVPHLDELSGSTDARVDVVDRQAALDGAEEPESAPTGEPLDLASTNDGFRLDFDSADIQHLSSEVPPLRSQSWNNALRAVVMAGAADLVTALVVAPPAAAIDITAHGVVADLGNNSWVATNAVSDGTRTVSGTFVVAWVGVGWLAEMRLSSDDGVYNNTKWFNGFVSNDGQLGWWDIYDTSGNVAGVVEWLSDGQGNAEFGIAAVTGDHAGDTLAYGFVDDGDAVVSYHDAASAQDSWVHVAPDRSGDLRAPDYNGGAPACWESADAADAYSDVACPE